MTNHKKQWNSFSFIGLVQVVAFLTVVSSILALFDNYHRFLELFANFKTQYLIASVVCAIILGLYKNYKLASILFIAATLNALYIVPWYFSDSKNHSNNSAQLKILHSNVYRDNQEFNHFIDLINQENPDVFVMQEVNEQWLSEIQILEKNYPHHYKTPRNDNFGIAMYSKHPFESVKKVKWIKFNVPSIEAIISLDDQLITIITTHPLPPINDEYYQARNGQIDKIAEISRNIEGPLIVIGDLNVTVWSDDYSTLERDTNLRNSRKGFGMLPTFPTQFQLPIFMIPIDHCLVSSHFTVQDIYTGSDIGSDHLPLIVELGLKKTTQ